MAWGRCRNIECAAPQHVDLAIVGSKINCLVQTHEGLVGLVPQAGSHRSAG